MTSYLIFDKTSNAANFNATIFGTSGARLAQPSGATRQALEVVNLGTSNALRVRSGAQHNAIVVGPSGTNGWGRVAGEVGPGGELLAVQQTHAWGVTSTERAVTIRATGPTGSVAYSIVIAGTNATGPSGY